MVSADAIIDYASAVATKISPQKVTLFGSYAHGSENDDSDVDLLMVMDYRGRAEREAARIRNALSAPFPLDLLVRRQSEIDRCIACNDLFLKEVMEKGLVLYAANDARVGEEGRGRLRRRHASSAVAQVSITSTKIKSRDLVRMQTSVAAVIITLHDDRRHQTGNRPRSLHSTAVASVQRAKD